MIDTKKPGAVPTALLHHLAPDQCLTVDQMAQALGVSRAQAVNAAQKLMQRNYLMKMAVGCFQLSPDGAAAAQAGITITSGPKGKTGAIATHRGTLRERAWTAMCIHRRFTIGDVVAAAGRDEEKNARENVRKYISALCRAGYVKEMSRRVPGTSIGSNGFKQFVLAKNTGPRAPVFRAELDVIHDFNIGGDVPCAPH